MNPIGRLLVAYRKHFKLTQKQLVEELSLHDEEFRNLNSVTLSRWETGMTAPSVRKKRKLIYFFLYGGCLRCEECRKITRECYEHLYEKLYHIFSDHYQYIVGNLPEQNIDEYRFASLKTFPEAKEHAEHIVDLERASNAVGYYTVTPEKMYEWCLKPSSVGIVAERKRQHLGHVVMFRLKTKTAQDIAYNRRSEMSLTDDDFCLPHERGTCYVHALYGRNPKIAAQLNVEIYLYFLDNMELIDNVMIFSTRKDGAKITKDYGIERVASGTNEEYSFKWYGMLSPVEDVLFSDTVIKMVF